MHVYIMCATIVKFYWHGMILLVVEAIPSEVARYISQTCSDEEKNYKKMKCKDKKIRHIFEKVIQIIIIYIPLVNFLLENG